MQYTQICVNFAQTILVSNLTTAKPLKKYLCAIRIVNEGYALFSIFTLTEPLDSILIWQEELYWIKGMCESRVVEHSFY